MTEEGAGFKWCPFVRKGDDGNRTRNYDGEDIAAACCCIGAACMAWRWGQKKNPDWKPDTGFSVPEPRHPEDKPPLYIEDREHGYCGLAGRP